MLSSCHYGDFIMTLGKIEVEMIEVTGERSHLAPPDLSYYPLEYCNLPLLRSVFSESS